MFPLHSASRPEAQTQSRAQQAAAALCLAGQAAWTAAPCIPGPQRHFRCNQQAGRLLVELKCVAALPHHILQLRPSAGRKGGAMSQKALGWASKAACALAQHPAAAPSQRSLFHGLNKCVATCLPEACSTETVLTQCKNAGQEQEHLPHSPTFFSLFSMPRLCSTSLQATRMQLAAPPTLYAFSKSLPRITYRFLRTASMPASCSRGGRVVGVGGTAEGGWWLQVPGWMGWVVVAGARVGEWVGCTESTPGWANAQHPCCQHCAHVHAHAQTVWHMCVHVHRHRHMHPPYACACARIGTHTRGPSNNPGQIPITPGSTPGRWQ